MLLKNEILTTSWGMQLRKSSLLSSEGLRDATPGGKPNIHQKKYPRCSANAEARSTWAGRGSPKAGGSEERDSSRSDQIDNSLQEKSLVFTGSNSGKLHNLHKVYKCLKCWSGKCHLSSDLGYGTNNIMCISTLMFLCVHGIHSLEIIKERINLNFLLSYITTHQAKLIFKGHLYIKMFSE